MSNTFQIKRGDTLPILRANLFDADGVVINLTNVATVKLHLTPYEGGANIERTMAKEVPNTGGWVNYAWLATDWTVAPAIGVGAYWCEIELTYVSGDVLTVPTRDYNTVVVYEDLD